MLSIILGFIGFVIAAFHGAIVDKLLSFIPKFEGEKRYVILMSATVILFALLVLLTAYCVHLIEMNQDAGNISILPLEETHTGPVFVGIDSELSGALYYTIDGTDPKASDTAKHYTDPFLIEESTTVGVRRKFLGFWSNVAMRSYVIELSKEEREKIYLQRMDAYILNGMNEEAREIASGLVLKDNADALCNLGYLHMMDAENSETKNDASLNMAEQCFLRSIELGNQQAEVNLLSLYLTHWYPFQSIADLLNQCIKDDNGAVVNYLRKVFPERHVEALTLSADDIQAFYSFEFTGMVVTSGWPTDTWEERYEFVGYDWDDTMSIFTKKIWNHYVQTPLCIDMLPVGFSFVAQ